MTQATESLIVRLWPAFSSAPARDGEQLLPEVPRADPFDWASPISEAIGAGHALTLRVPSTNPGEHVRVEVRDVGNMHPMNALMEPYPLGTEDSAPGMVVVLATRWGLVQAWDEDQFEGECALVYQMAEIPPGPRAWGPTDAVSPPRGYVSADGRAALIACEDLPWTRSPASPGDGHRLRCSAGGCPSLLMHSTS